MEENKIIESYLKPVLGDLMNKSLSVVLELKENGNLEDLKQNKKFFLEFLNDALSHYDTENLKDKREITRDLIEFIDKL